MLGIIFSIVAGAAMSLQGVFNTRLGQKIGLWETSVFVQGIALISSLVAAFAIGDGSFRAIKDANKLYLLGGVLGAIITFTVMRGIGALGTTLAIAIILVAQLTAAAAIDHFGLFGAQCVRCGFRQLLGVAIMIVGILIFKWKS
ncbi:transporter family-2 protein [Clostridium punense]|uniref:Transporter family-2 protein n=1 Tax=Clostridium punense TaxID=1054297 RepID=A0ABS4K6P3_9CLOT|nr:MULTISPECIES: DMT family transporter [Clostridium]EQB85792.1 hypothetical protein M918_17535 [Clostridium sp. BL8]MBP2023452.1 transporter family-2 protein [Clostridium punense]